VSRLPARLSRSRWVRRLAGMNLVGLLVIVLGVLLAATVLGEQSTWFGWLLGVLGLVVAVALVAGRRWARELAPAEVPVDMREVR
jgi:protein-S-isoprenylcysteine O-methyltransferase Ste14